ncbi:hypothetical protein [Parapedobacter sp. 10938]|uniref:hypothetical protein n=1 Tax=Parapedobacter flavus TaxID=3110225 RepID=UPI002DBB048E|nr:hypothetical protein [Parapedobacter sp. 10938]MEC3880226.1 hypothetical protein [Parapedobacter sp. 10938]
MRFPVLYIVAILILSCSDTRSCRAQTLQQPYQRLQYHKYQWQTFHTTSFHLYYPKGYDSLCAFIAKNYLSAAALLKKRTGGSLDKTPHIILYPSIDQLYETNIGSFEPIDQYFPTVVLKGNRIVLAYNGNREALLSQLHQAMARTIWEETFNNGLPEQLKGGIVNDKIPNWFKEGWIRYVADGWAIHQEDELKRSFEKEHFVTWQEVTYYQPVLSGAAFCYYINRVYYPQAVRQLYTQLRKKKDLRRALRLVTKKGLDSVLIGCLDFYQKRFQIKKEQVKAQTGWKNDIGTTADSFTLKFSHPKGIVKNVQFSNDGTFIAYILYTRQKRSVYIYQTTTGKNIKLCSYPLPPWMKDYSKNVYPLISWEDDANKLIILYPKKGSLFLQLYNANGKTLQERNLYKLDGVTSIEAYTNPYYLLSAFKQGNSDFITYDYRRDRYKGITNDDYDDSQPTSNKTYPIAYISKQELKRKIIHDKTDSTYWVQGIFQVDDKQPVVSDTLPYIIWDKSAYLSDGSILATHTREGEERFAITKNNSVTTLSAYRPYSLYNHHNDIAFYKATADSIFINTIPVTTWMQSQVPPSDNMSPWLKDYQADAALRAKEDSILQVAKANSEPGFLEGVLKGKNSKALSRQRRDSIYQSLLYTTEKIKPYILQLHSAYFTARVNNDYFINRYQPYQNYQGQFKFPDVGAMMQGGFTDLFENHHFNIGYRLPAGKEGSDFFVRYESTKKLWDWGVQYFRKVESLQPDPRRNWEDENGRSYPNNAKVKTHYYELSIKRPVSYYSYLSFTTGLRKDRTVFLATEDYSLRFKDLNSLWSINTLAWQYQNLKPTLPMLYNGFSTCVALNVFAGLQGITNESLYDISTSIEYHQSLYRHITAVARLQAGYSGGRSKVLYNIGGVDNNLTVKTDTSVHFAQDAPYAFQSLVTPLRGFYQNAVRGNQYALMNIDVYFPFFQSLIPIETNFSAINHLQVGLFTDVAYARETWRSSGSSAVSYGFSIRTLLAGYPIRVDAALPNRQQKNITWYLSLGID